MFGRLVKGKSKAKGPCLVDAMILGLSKMRGESVSRREKMDYNNMLVSFNEIKPKAEEAITLGFPTAAASTVTGVSNPSDPPSRSHHHAVLPDLTTDELPKFTPHPSHPRTHRVHLPTHPSHLSTQSSNMDEQRQKSWFLVMPMTM